MFNIYEQVDRNKKRSFIVIVAFIIFVLLVSFILSKTSGYGNEVLILGLFFSSLMSFGSFWHSDKIILAMSNAKPAFKKEFYDYYTVTENLSIAAQIPMPKLYVINDPSPNAFATGRDPNHSSICVTTGLLKKLDRTELEGVIGHEISHIRNYDTRLMSIVVILVGMITLLSDWFLRGIRMKRRDRDEEFNDGVVFVAGIITALFAPLIAQLIKFAISRRREFLADANSAMLTRYPEGLIRALKKISNDNEILGVSNRAMAHLYFVNPLNGKKITNWIDNLFNTHPPVEERIKALQGLV